MNKHGNDDRSDAAAGRSKRALLQTLLFSAGSLATTLLTLSFVRDLKLPRYQGE